MRNYLNDIQIFGATLMSRTGDLSHYCLRSLLDHCDKVVVVLDNPDELTRSIVLSYAEKDKRVDVVFSKYPGTTPEEEAANPDKLRLRFKSLQGPIRQQVFARLHERYKSGEKIDMILFPDSDEMFGQGLENVLKEFWPSQYKAVVMKAVDVFASFDTIHDEGMTGHIRIMKYSPDLSADPHRWRCYYSPLKRSDCMGTRFSLIHLSLLTQEMIDWKVKNWGYIGLSNSKIPLWRVGKDVRECSPQEIQAAYNREPDLTIGDFLHGGEKRCPVGVENAQKALSEAHKMLQEMGIRHFLAFGTALMVYRDNALQKWDWDVDLLMMGEDLPKFNRELLSKYGFDELKIKQDIPKWINSEGGESPDLYVRTISFKKYGVRIDIDPAYLGAVEQDYYVLKGRKRQKFAAALKREWLDNPKEIVFNEETFLIPGDIEAYIESNYGPDWRTPVNGPTDWRDRACTRYQYGCK